MGDDRAGRSIRLAWGAVAFILVAVVVLVTYALTRGSTPATAAQTARTSPGVLDAVSAVPADMFDAVGVTVPGTQLTPPRPVSGPPLTAHGVPEVLFIGSEFCPFCAAERWPLVVALARFGRFGELHDATSSTQAIFPGTPTFSFEGVQYTSRYVAFIGVELYSDQVGADGSFTRIATPTPAQTALLDRYACPAVATTDCPSPFVDVAGLMVATTSGFSPALLAGLSESQIAASLSERPTQSTATADLTPPAGEAVVAVANQLTAGICEATHQLPGSVCRSKGVRAADLSLGLSAPAVDAAR